MSEEHVIELLERAGDRHVLNPPPIEQMQQRTQRTRRRRRTARATVGAFVVGAAVAATVVITGGDGQDIQPPPPAHQPTRAEIDRANYIVQRQLAKQDATLTSANLVIVTDPPATSNSGYRCTSNRVLQIQMIGSFPTVAVGGVPGISGDDEVVHAANLSADADTGKVCLTSVTTGKVTPDPDGTPLEHKGLPTVREINPSAEHLDFRQDPTVQERVGAVADAISVQLPDDYLGSALLPEGPRFFFAFAAPESAVEQIRALGMRASVGEYRGLSLRQAIEAQDFFADHSPAHNACWAEQPHPERMTWIVHCRTTSDIDTVRDFARENLPVAEVRFDTEIIDVSLD